MKLLLKHGVRLALMAALSIAGCIGVPVYEPYPVIIPPAPPIVVAPGPPVIAGPGGAAFICDDPTRGLVRNTSPNITYRIWASPTFGASEPPKGEPTAVIPPGAEVELYLHPRASNLYYEGGYSTVFGEFQTQPRTVKILVERSTLTRGCYGWFLYLPASGRYWKQSR